MNNSENSNEFDQEDNAAPPPDDAAGLEPSTLPPPPRLPHCDEEPSLLADFRYIAWGKTHYVSRKHLVTVTHRLKALGLIDRDREPDLVELVEIPRERPPEETIDWRAVAVEYRNEADSLREQMAALTDRLARADGDLAVRDARVDKLNQELAAIKHLLKAPSA